MEWKTRGDGVEARGAAAVAAVVTASGNHDVVCVNTALSAAVNGAYDGLRGAAMKDGS